MSRSGLARSAAERRRLASARPRIPLILTGVLAAACADAPGDVASDTPGPIAASVRDSAGITIRTDPRAVEQLPVLAVVREEPSVVLGLDESVPAELFIDVGDIASHPDHGIAVADVEAPDIRLFDWSGRPRGTIGGPGEGPGEFGGIHSLEGDSTLWVWDWNRGRISRFDWSGTLLHDLPVDASGMVWGGVVTATPSGHLVIGHYIVQDPPDDLGYRLRADSIDLRIVDSAGEPVAHFGRVTASEWVDHMSAFRDIRVHGMILRSLGGIRFVKTLGDTILLTRGDVAEFSLYDTGATLHEIWRFPGLVRPVTPASLDAWTTRWSARHLELGDTFEVNVTPGFLEEFPPQTFPAFVDLVVSDSGDLWLGPAATSDRRTLVVVSGDGELRGRVELPTDLDVRAVSEGRVVGVVTDEFGVEQVRIHDLISAG